MTVSGGGGGDDGGGVSTVPSSSTAATAPPSTNTVSSSSRRRRDSSDDFGTAGSLGSIGGSEVGSSVHSTIREEVEGTSGEHSHALLAYTIATITPAATAAASPPLTATTAPTPTVGVIAGVSNTSSSSPDKMPAPPPPIPHAMASTPQKPSTEATGGSSIAFEAQKTPLVSNTSSAIHTAPPTTTTTMNNTTTTSVRKSSLKSESSLNSTTTAAQPLDHHRPPKKRKGSVDFTLDSVKPTSHQYRHHPTNVTTTMTATTTAATEMTSETTDPVTNTTDAALSLVHAPLHLPPSQSSSSSLLLLGSDDPLPPKYRSGSDSQSSSHGFSLGRLLRADTLDSSLGHPTTTTTTSTSSTTAAPLPSSQLLLPPLFSGSRLRADTLERLDALGDEARLAASRIRTNSMMTTTTTTSNTTSGTTLGLGMMVRTHGTTNSVMGADLSVRSGMTNTSLGSQNSGHGMIHSLASHRLLLEAFMGGDDAHTDNDHHDEEDEEADQDDGDVKDDDDEDEAAMELDEDAESLVDSHAAEQAETQELTKEQHRDRFESFDVVVAAAAIASSSSRERLGSFDHHVRDRLGSFDHHVRDRLGSFDVRERLGSFDVATAAAATLSHHHPYEMLRRRDRLESWGGMSDLSLPVVDSTGTDSFIGMGTATGGSAGGINNTTAALAAAVYTSLANDLSAAANLDGNESISDFLVHDDHEKIPSKISMSRDRLNSIHSTATDPSIFQLQNEHEIPSEIQKIVKQAMASVGDQLAGIAEAATEAARDLEDHSELSSTASPMIGAMLDGSSKTGGSFNHRQQQNRPRSSSLTTGMDIAVDYAAVAAAVNAAEAAAGAMDLAVFAHSASTSVASNTSSAPKSASGAKRKRPKLPTKRSKKTKAAKPAATVIATTTPKRPVVPIELPPIPKSKLDERDMEMIRERARAAAGYVPPATLPPVGPSKKKAKLGPQTPSIKVAASSATPRTIQAVKSTVSTPYTPASSTMSTPGSARSCDSKRQSSQKWDSMFDCLLEFVEDRRKEDCIDMTDAEKKAWVWDGNVPTTFKAKDGKALGRWINNQRSAKSKGVLKDDREKRLIDAGLKWSVLASNSWNEMLDELRVYVNEQTKSGRKWDGNVPTNYRITPRPGVVAREDEDKNLGRWVNRQRSLYQAGKLRKDRQLSLEKVGLKWSMLATMSWDSMYETLEEYVQEKNLEGSEWDGNVPANYRTTHNPPRALGRWINRQRSAFGKDKLKDEYIDKLNKIGLKWSVHERRPGTYPDIASSGVVVSAPSSGTDSSPMPNQVPSSATTPAIVGIAAATPTPAAINSEPQEEGKRASTTASCTSSSTSSCGSSRASSRDAPPSAPSTAPATKSTDDPITST